MLLSKVRKLMMAVISLYSLPFVLSLLILVEDVNDGYDYRRHEYEFSIQFPKKKISCFSIQEAF